MFSIQLIKKPIDQIVTHTHTQLQVETSGNQPLMKKETATLLQMTPRDPSRPLPSPAIRPPTQSAPALENPIRKIHENLFSCINIFIL